METVMKADVFFVITTIAVIVLSIFAAIVLWYVFKTFKNLSVLSEKVKDEGIEILDAVKNVREKVKTESDHVISDFREMRQDFKASPVNKIAQFLAPFSKFFMNKKSTKSTEKKK